MHRNYNLQHMSMHNNCTVDSQRMIEPQQLGLPVFQTHHHLLWCVCCQSSTHHLHHPADFSVDQPRQHVAIWHYYRYVIQPIHMPLCVSLYMSPLYKLSNCVNSAFPTIIISIRNPLIYVCVQKMFEQHRPKKNCLRTAIRSQLTYVHYELCVYIRSRLVTHLHQVLPIDSYDSTCFVSVVVVSVSIVLWN